MHPLVQACRVSVPGIPALTSSAAQAVAQPSRKSAGHSHTERLSHQAPVRSVSQHVTPSRSSRIRKPSRLSSRPALANSLNPSRSQRLSYCQRRQSGGRAFATTPPSQQLEASHAHAFAQSRIAWTHPSSPVKFLTPCMFKHPSTHSSNRQQASARETCALVTLHLFPYRLAL